MAQAALATPWPALRQELEKKATFESACVKAMSMLSEQPAQAGGSELATLLRRVRTLLRSRHSAPAFWMKGRQLFQAVAAITADAGLRAELISYVAECNEFLGDGPSSSRSDEAAEQQERQQWQQAAARRGATSNEPFLFEGQMSAGEPAPRPHGLLDVMHMALAAQLQAQQQEGGQPASAAGAGSGAELQGQDGQEQGQEQGLPQLSPELMEQLQQHLDAIAVEIMEESGQQVPRPAPPASKRVVSSLPKELLTAERIAALGGEGERCPVCMEEYSVGDEVQSLPCRHTFHPPCVAPWLEQNNSCPTCRHELPTDDQEYERRKEREKVEAEERRGAELATSGAEFLYI